MQGRLGTAAACDVCEPKPTASLKINRDVPEEIRDCSLSAESAVDFKDDDDGDDATDSGFSHDFQNNDSVIDVPLS